MEFDSKVFVNQYPTVESFVQHLSYYRVVADAMDSLTHNREFWMSVRNGHLKLATIAWCMVFGTYGEHLHWTKTPTGDNAEIAKQDFRARLLLKTGFTVEQWKTYRRDLLDFRNKYVAHFDLLQEFSRPIPRFEPALHVAYAYHEWVRVLIKGMWRIDHTLSPLYYEQCKAEAISVINSQKPKG